MGNGRVRCRVRRRVLRVLRRRAVRCRPHVGGLSDLIEGGTAVTRAVDDAVEIEHPHEDDLGFLYGTILTGDANTDANSRSVCVFADGEVNRCPTGTGVSGRVALRATVCELDRGERFVGESIVGSTFVGSYTETTDLGGHDTVQPRIEGSVHVTGRHRFVVDPADPFDEGFMLRWGLSRLHDL